jgi:short-subunit dehydrogenase
VVVTGASAGLGAALARAYAAPRVAVGLMARRATALDAVATSCQEAGSSVETAVLDVQDAAGQRDWLAALDARHPLDLVIVNAGMFEGIAADGRLEDMEVAEALIATNLTGAIATASAAAVLMRARRRGRIALIASLAARHPLADAPVYSATKAGLVAYGEALRERLAADGVGVSIVLPGHIATAQTARHRGALPGLMSAEAAATRIRRGLDQGADTIAFPSRLAVLAGLGRLLPWRLRAYATRSLRFTVDPPTVGAL